MDQFVLEIRDLSILGEHQLHRELAVTWFWPFLTYCLLGVVQSLNQVMLLSLQFLQMLRSISQLRFQQLVRLCHLKQRLNNTVSIQTLIYAQFHF
jgi:hypothetical protein